MEDEIQQELKVARERLETAELLLDNDRLADAAGRAYYSMFHAAKALLKIYGREPKPHEGLISEFGLVFVKTGLCRQGIRPHAQGC